MLTDSQKKSIANYSKLGIEIEILKIEKNIVTVKISQKRLLNGYILNQKQLVERAKKLFEPTEFVVKVIPVVYSLDVSFINIEWIKNRMKEFGIKRKDLVKQIAIDKSSLNLIFSENTKLSNRTKATFYYYFLTYQINQEFRNGFNEI